MGEPAAPSLRRLLLGYELSFFLLVVVTGAVGAAAAYFWQQTSTETLRLTRLQDAAQEIHTLAYRQLQEVALARLRADPDAEAVYSGYYADIQAHFNRLRQNSASRAEDYAIQHYQEAYSQLQAELNGIFEDARLLNRLVRSRQLDPAYEQSLVQGLELRFRNLSGLLKQGLAWQQSRIRMWTRYAPLALTISVLLALSLIWRSRRSLKTGFVRPMQSLTRHTARLAGGELTVRLPREGVSEVAELAQGINRMAAELAASRDALVESERQAALGALVPVVAHNIRNPLASIRANAQLLQHAESPEESLQIGDDIIESVDRLGRWVSALVSYLHPLEPQLAPLNAVELLEAVCSLLKPRLTEKSLRLAREPWDATQCVAVDRDLMEQALYGLINNAVEASAAGSVLRLGVAGEAGRVTIVIEDEAGGIPFIPRPSDLSPGRTTKRFGTGLGIPIAFKVAKAHGWELVFEVVDNKGTRITLTAPALDTAHAPV